MKREFSFINAWQKKIVIGDYAKTKSLHKGHCNLTQKILLPCVSPLQRSISK